MNLILLINNHIKFSIKKTNILVLLYRILIYIILHKVNYQTFIDSGLLKNQIGLVQKY